ncbi:MAG TPA: hypothetical protein VJ773_05130, partial [Gemmatimonadales bacterium]|nr:hypothetical protein [Gemmatimonadales bacterium]
AAALRRYLDDPGFARRVGATGRHAAETFYNWDRVARTLRTLGEAHGREGGVRAPRPAAP